MYIQCYHQGVVLYFALTEACGSIEVLNRKEVIWLSPTIHWSNESFQRGFYDEILLGSVSPTVFNTQFNFPMARLGAWLIVSILRRRQESRGTDQSWRHASQLHCNEGSFALGAAGLEAVL